MLVYDIFFFGALFFLMGVLFGSLGLTTGILVITVFLGICFVATKFYIKNKKFLWLACLTPFILFGAMYYHFDDMRFRNAINFRFGEEMHFTGIVSKDPVIGEDAQTIILSLDAPFGGNVAAKIPLYPRFHYGDRLKGDGVIEIPFPEGYANYLQKERVSGVMRSPQLQFISAHNASRIWEALFSFRERMVGAFAEFLPPKEAGFFTGLTIGGSAGLPKTFRDAMSASGTTHLVALSGYNITIIVWAAMSVFALFFRKQTSFVLATFVMVLFVLMTGAEASVVRAAIMAFLVLLAGHLGRVYDVRNAIIFAGIVMVLQNPKVLVFDVGFQLSFLALLGILYLKPALQKIFHISDTVSIFSWKENFLTTASAQLMVLPILITNFTTFSFTSLFANILILEIVPLVMALGFCVALLSFISYYAGLFMSWVAYPFLKYQIVIIELFAKFRIGISSSFSEFGFVFYYCCIALCIAYGYGVFKKNRKT